MSTFSLNALNNSEQNHWEGISGTAEDGFKENFLAIEIKNNNQSGKTL